MEGVIPERDPARDPGLGTGVEIPAKERIVAEVRDVTKIGMLRKIR
jgi:hypothetical protein